jgi:hypothetical protein
MSTKGFEETMTRHRALVQLHRWYQLYERPITPERLTRQLQILDKDIVVDSTRGKVTGHDGYLQGVGTLDPTDLNSHRVRSATVQALGGGKIALAAETTYQLMKRDGTLTGVELHYDAILHDADELPIFDEIRVTLKGRSSETEFVDAYADNRVRSFVHAWLWQMERVGGSAEGFRELLGQNGLDLLFSTDAKPITSYEQLAAWFAGVGARVAKSSHRESGLQIAVSGAGQYAVDVDFDWSGTDKADNPLAGQTRHHWLLEDRGERFCRLKQARVTALRPLGPA